MGITPGMVLGGIGLAGGLAGMFGGNKPSNVQLPPQQFNYAPQTTGSIGGLGQYNLGAQFSPDVSGIGQGFMANPYAGGFQGAANQFSPYGTANSLQALTNAGMLGGMVAPQLGAAGTIIQAGFDPQSALYNRTAQQVSDQALAGLSNSGLATTPWGQGVYGKTMGDFNIDWQNNLLNRMTQGAQGAEGLIGSAGATGAGAFGLGRAGMMGGVEAGALPYNAYNTMLGNQLGGLQGVASYGNTIGQLPATQAGDWLNYMGNMNQFNLGQAGLGLQQQQQGFNQNQILGRDIGGSLAMMTGAVSPGQMFGRGGGATGWGQQQPGSYGYYG